ncbi:hypothetical protein EYF80_010115 [Liparis tanakae]|uniref:Uncharacterized protein n=1 Tax=Liparis tanakae TaxID=230148 RepID=A0A4Z2IQT5_9TELE|nr:hypothetical protein EYF80_010115 [Liparis tanakae]
MAFRNHHHQTEGDVKVRWQLYLSEESSGQTETGLVEELLSESELRVILDEETSLLHLRTVRIVTLLLQPGRSSCTAAAGALTHPCLQSGKPLCFNWESFFSCPPAAALQSPIVTLCGDVRDSSACADGHAECRQTENIVPHHESENPVKNKAAGGPGVLLQFPESLPNAAFAPASTLPHPRGHVTINYHNDMVDQSGR